MSDIFISYAREDESRARALAEALTRLGWSVWYDRALVPAEEFDQRIEQELDAARCVLVIWSRASVQSKWVRAEAEAGDVQGKLLPVAFDFGVVPPIRFRQLNYAMLSSPTLEPPDDAVHALLMELAALTGKAPRGGQAGDLRGVRTGGRSGARTVTAGRWLLTTRFLFSEATYDLQLLPSGMVTGKGSWTISRAILSGRWQYDASQQLLQLELSGGIQEGVRSMLVRITGWKDDHTAGCIFEGRKAQLRKVPG